MRKLEFQLEAIKDQQSHRETELQQLLDSTNKECDELKSDLKTLKAEKKDLMSQLDSLRTTFDQKMKQARSEALKEAERQAAEGASTLEQKLRMESEAMKNACTKELERADQKL